MNITSRKEISLSDSLVTSCVVGCIALSSLPKIERAAEEPYVRTEEEQRRYDDLWITQLIKFLENN